ncbi:MAG TPA: hypothetical protein VF591_11490 [Pyrinomonadaceae bacterium]|jgi:hypothetical protein
MHIELPETVIEEIAERVKKKLEAETLGSRDERDAVAAEYQLRLSRIRAKENISIQDAAFLLNCSDGHLRNLIKKAKHRKTSRPIPFNDLDGLCTFNREELLAWSRDQRQRTRDGAEEVRHGANI